jgi:alpha,alpha-trehalase
VTTNEYTGQQWDAPNGWAPLQWITFIGLKNYDAAELAEEAAERWLTLNEQVYQRTGRLMEKYNVEDLSLQAGGGEYSVQDGFGWTNGVFLALSNEIAKE